MRKYFVTSTLLRDDKELFNYHKLLKKNILHLYKIKIKNITF